AGGAAEYWIRPAGARDLVGIAAVAISGVAALASGGALHRYGRRHHAASGTMTRREATLAVVLIWVFSGVFGGLPFVLGAGMTPTDAFFEAISGLTTTGATVITDIEVRLSHPLLLWRSLLQWLGGMGIVVLFVAVFPTVGAGAKHMFKGEVPGTTAEGLAPRIAETSFTLWKLYAGFTVLLAGILIALGMSPFESVCHALTALSTGGFSTRDASIAAFDSAAIEYVLAIFMLIGSVNYALYHAMLRMRSIRVFLLSTELKAFVAIVIVTTAILTVGILGVHGGDPLEAFRYAFFTVATFISSTGYGTDDYMTYPHAMVALIVIVMFIGGCSGSTAGGLKVERVVLLWKLGWAEIHRSFRPAVIRVVRMGRAAVPPDVLMDVAVFFGVFMLCLGGGVFLVTLFDPVGPAAAFGATLTCLSNMGPAPFHEGPDNFAAYSDASKIFFSLAMLLGRLEFFTMFALLVPDFWRR
ncbi:MAG: TrkH family potassium uptake protein, partial [Myxococcota bacterium]|nr:TrkH family potassium uptake protein [Myxococcota bacterium]